MRMEQLQPDQLLRLAEVLKRHRDYLSRVRDRLRSLGFHHDDRLLDAITNAHAAVSNTVVVAASEANRRNRKPESIEPKRFFGE